MSEDTFPRSPFTNSGRRFRSAGSERKSTGISTTRNKTSRRLSMRRGGHGQEDRHVAAFRRTFVEHSYHDHLHDPVDEQKLPAPPAVVEVETANKRGLRGGVTVAFPEKLHTMLAAMDAEGTSHVISWQPHGRSFLIHKKKEFVDRVMSRFFHQSKLTSFQRQLNLYGFVRLTAGQDRGGYYHERFLRGRPDLCHDMTRTRIKGNGMKAASSPNTEPNFYEMEFCSEISKTASKTTKLGRKVSTDEGDTYHQPPTAVPFPLPLKSVLSNTFEPLRKRHSKQYPDTTVSTIPNLALKMNQPTLISPHESPQQERRREAVLSPFSIPNATSLLSWHLMPRDENRVLWEDDSTASTPHTGDVVHFEGLQFRYLDHLDVDDFPDVCGTDQINSCVWV